MPSIHVTEGELQFIINALRTAATEYSRLADRPDVAAVGLSGQFRAQAEGAEHLAQKLED